MMKYFILIIIITISGLGAGEEILPPLLLPEEMTAESTTADTEKSATTESIIAPAAEPATSPTSGTAVNEEKTAITAQTPAEINDILLVMERLFNSGNYQVARNICFNLLEKNPHFAALPSGSVIDSTPANTDFYQPARLQRQKQREQTRYYHARSLCEEALLMPRGPRAKELMMQAVQDFVLLAKNFWQFTNANYQAFACHYAGRGYDYLTDYPQAIDYFRLVGQYDPTAELDIENSLYLARSLQDQAEIIGDEGITRSPQDNFLPPALQKKRADLLREAEQELAKIATYHPQSDRHSDVELMLIELRYNLGNYGDVQYQANDYLRRANPGTDEYAKAAYFLANAVYRQNNLLEAAKLFEQALAQKITDPKLRGELFYGQGRVNGQIAQTASVETRQQYLARAQTALRQAVKLLPFGRIREEAVCEFARTLLELKEYREADRVLHEVLDNTTQNTLKIPLYYYAGLSAQGLRDYPRAHRYLQSVIEFCSSSGRDLRYALQAISALAKVENSRGRYAEALSYYRAEEFAAEALREYDLYAQAKLAGASVQAGLNIFNAEKRNAAANRLVDSVLAIMVSANKDDNAIDVQTATRMVTFRAYALREWNNASAENLAAALKSLQDLRGRLLTRLREDELEYVEGKIIFHQADSKRKQIPLTTQSELKDDFLPIFTLYQRAEDIIEKSIVANPRGSFSAAARFLLGQILSETATLRLELAKEFRRRGLGGEAVPMEAEAEQEYQNALNPLTVSITDAEDDTNLRIAARTLLGNTYLNLAKISKDRAKYYERGLDELRILVNEPSLDSTQKTAAVRGIAAALSGGERLDEALQLLLAQSARDLFSALQAKTLLLAQNAPRLAHKTLHESISHADKDHPALCEAQYELAVLGLNRAAEIAPENEQKAQIDLRQISMEQLLKIAETYAGSEWSSLALLALGEYLIGAKKYDRAIAYAEAALKDSATAVVTLQSLYLLKGRAELAWGIERKDNDLIETAKISFSNAERANISDNPLGRTQRAYAILEQGNVYHALQNTEEALRFYGRVFAIFHQEYAPSDLARLHAAAIHEQRKNYELAWRILDQGFDPEKLLPAKLRIKSLIDAQKDK